MNVDQLSTEAMKLSQSERMQLVLRVLHSVEPRDDPAEVKRAWAEEIERRLYDAGDDADMFVPVEEVLRDMRARLR